MPLRIVLVTSPPARKAPENSKITAMMIACLIVIAREPTEVPMALATSLAPTPQAMKKPKAAAMMSRVIPCSCMISTNQSSLLSGLPAAWPFK